MRLFVPALAITGFILNRQTAEVVTRSCQDDGPRCLVHYTSHIVYLRANTELGTCEFTL
jgi:hypothetical protein